MQHYLLPLCFSLSRAERFVCISECRWSELLVERELGHRDEWGWLHGDLQLSSMKCCLWCSALQCLAQHVRHREWDLAVVWSDQWSLCPETQSLSISAMSASYGRLSLNSLP